MPSFSAKAHRALLAAAVAATMLVTFAALGGVGFAKSAVGAAQYQYGKKATVCHKGKKTITIGQPAVKAHLKHGDTLGTCASARAKAAKAKAAKAKAAKAAKAKAAKANAAKGQATAAAAKAKAKPAAGKPASPGAQGKGHAEDKPGKGKGRP